MRRRSPVAVAAMVLAVAASMGLVAGWAEAAEPHPVADGHRPVGRLAFTDDEAGTSTAVIAATATATADARDPAPEAEIAPTTTSMPVTTVPAPMPTTTTTTSTTASAQAAAPPSASATRADPVQAAIDRVGVDLSAWGWRLEILGPRSGRQAETTSDDRTVRLFVRSEQSVDELAWILAHEVGHVVDIQFTTTFEREDYAELRGFSPDDWWGNRRPRSDFALPAGDFAEVYAVWKLRTPSPFGWESRMAPPPTDGQLAALGGIFDH